MQFIYPELLWALFLLLIPILIHLFQLRRFRKTPFTNVRLLKKVVAKSRRSRSLKKWLLLATRLLFLTAVVLAFARPFFANNAALDARELVVYLDDSFSMQARDGNGSLMETAVQDIIRMIPREEPFSLFTNTEVFRNITIRELQNQLLTLPHTHVQLEFGEIGLKAGTLFSNSGESRKNLVIVSDFQQRMAGSVPDSAAAFQHHLVRLEPDSVDNVAIDTAYISSAGTSALELTAVLSRFGSLDNIPVSLFNGDKLIAKTAAVFDGSSTAEVLFTLPREETIDGRMEISDPSLSYDNTLFFNIEQKEKIRVQVIGDLEADFLRRIYSEDEFQLAISGLEGLNYSTLESQHLIVLNQLPAIPNSLQHALNALVSEGGSLAVIPNSAADLSDYNNFLSRFFNTGFTAEITGDRNITAISFNHPLYEDVFEKRITNFQYPRVSRHYQVRTTAPPVLSFQGGAPFLLGVDGVFIFTAPIDSANSNFKNSPLIVPTFYSMGIRSLKLPLLYYTIGQPSVLDVPVVLARDHILRLRQGAYEFIPQQQSFASKTSLNFVGAPEQAGVFTILDRDSAVSKVSFNYDRGESEMVYSDPEAYPAAGTYSDLPALFGRLEKVNEVRELWKWFVILALCFLVAEVLIQKYLK